MSKDMRQHSSDFCLFLKISPLIETSARPLDLATITKAFKGARKPKVQEILDALTDLGRLTRTDDHHWQG